MRMLRRVSLAGDDDEENCVDINRKVEAFFFYTDDDEDYDKEVMLK